MTDNQINNTVREAPEEMLRDALFYSGLQWEDQLTAKQIDNIINLFKILGLKVMG